MPRCKEVPTLYYQALDIVFEDIFDLLNFDRTPDEYRELRMFFCTTLPGTIRQHIINLAVLKDRNRIQYTLDLIGLLADANVWCIRPALDNCFLLAEHYETLIDILYNNNCIGLNALLVKVIYDRSITSALPDSTESNRKFGHLLANGLGHNLRELTLDGVCNNDILQAVGRHCQQLHKLNVSSSWTVTDVGIMRLLLKDAFLENNKLRSFNGSSSDFSYFFNMDDNCLNHCCNTLSDVRFKGTNTSHFSVILLLVFAKNLETFGFVYDRTVVEALSLLLRNWKLRRTLALKEICDPDLTHEILTKLHGIAPNLSSIHSLVKCLAPVPTPFKFLHTLRLDFDEQYHDPLLFAFLQHNGAQIKNIFLEDQAFPTDLCKIAQFCPELEQLKGHVKVDYTDTPCKMRKLQKVILKLNSAECLVWLFKYACILEMVEIMIYCQPWNDFSEANEVDNRFFKLMISIKPDCLQTLKYFNLTVTDVFTVSKKTIKRFISYCPNLRLFGDFDAIYLPGKSFTNLLTMMKRCNYNISLRKQLVDHPRLQGDPCTERGILNPLDWWNK